MVMRSGSVYPAKVGLDRSGSRVRGAAVLVLMATVAPAGPALAADFPVKPVRLIVPFPPGGANDFTARLLAPALGSALGQNVLIDNRPGGGANIGAEVVAKSIPDGHALLMGAVVHSVNATLYSKLAYSITRDFAPVTLLATTPNILVVHPSVPAKSVKDLIALVRSRPGQLDYASAGNGSAPHLAGALFNSMAGTTMVHIPYKGSAPAMVALISGECAVGFVSAPSVLQHVKSGRLRGIAITGTRRSAMVPDLPTVNEAGVRGYESGGWFGLLAPAGTPAEVVNRLQADTVKVLEAPDMRERMETNGLTFIGSTPAQFATYLRGEVEKWGKVVRSAGMQVE
jgi:tripartite-type tricarboxylate transporter receptor subunit TctC